MEYRCYIVGDTVTEPGALLRRLLHQSFPETEERALQLQSLLSIRSEEIKGVSDYPMTVSLPNLQEPRTASLTLPNPSMPSVDIAVQFAAITDPREFERVMLSHYKSSGVSRTLARGLRRSHSSPASSYQDLLSSDVSSLPSSAHGLALQAPPHAIVLTFNPFSTCSFSRLRVVWVHSVRVLQQQHRQQLMNSAVQQQLSNRPSSTVFHGPSVPASPLSPGYPMELMEHFPVVLLVATRMELMRDTMEATPSVHVPSLLEVTEVAQALQAQAYVEVGTNWDESLSVLRTTIARACMGELTNVPLVSYTMAYGARQASVARAIEAVQMDSCEDEEGEDNNNMAAAAGLPSSPVSFIVAATSQKNRSITASGYDNDEIDQQQKSPETSSRTNNNNKREKAEEEEKAAKVMRKEAQKEPQDAADAQQAEQEDGKKQDKNENKVVDTSFNSASTSVLTAPFATVSEGRAERRTSEPKASDIQSIEHLNAVKGDENTKRRDSDDSDSATLSNSTVQEPKLLTTPMPAQPPPPPHSVTAVGPLAIDGGASQPGNAERTSRPPPSPQLHSTPITKLKTTAAAAAPSPGDGEGDSDTTRQGPSSSATATTPSSSSKWTWRRHAHTGRIFYAHRTSGRSQYDCPDDYDGPPAMSANSNSTAEVSKTNPEATEDEVPRNVRPIAEEEGGHANMESGRDAYTQSALQASHAGTHTGETPEKEEVEGKGTTTTTPKSEEDQRMYEDVDSWCRRQQLQLRCTQVERLERQVQQLRLQSERLRAQSAANTVLKQKSAALRAELEAKEQTFSARVAEKSQQLAKEMLSTTMAVEELTAPSTTPWLPLPKGSGEATGSGGAAHLAVAYGEHDGKTNVPLAALTKGIRQLDADIKACMQSLQQALARRDIEADALKTLQSRRQLVAQRKREAEAEMTTLLKQSVIVEEALLPLQEGVNTVQDEARRLRDRVRAAEEKNLLREQQRQRQLEAYVAQKRSTEAQVRHLDRLRQHRAAALEAYEASLQHFSEPSRAKPAEVREEHQRLRLGLESTTGRCAEALLLNAEAVHTLTLLVSDVQTVERRIWAQQAEQREHLLHAYEVAEARRAEAVQQRYRSQFHNNPDSSNSSYGPSHTQTELLDAAVDACAEAFEQWEQHDTRIAAPLLERARSVEAELLLFLRSVTGALLHRKSLDTNVPPHIDQSTYTHQQQLWHEWLQCKVADIRQSVEEHCREPFHTFMQHLAAFHKETEFDANAEGSTVFRPLSSAASSTTAPREDHVQHPSPALLPAVTMADYAAEFERGLWSTCDELVNRLSPLDGSFVSLYNTTRQSSTPR